MSTLVVCALLDVLQLQGGELGLPCLLSEELQYSGRVGEDILVASLADPSANTYVALGRLAGFASDLTGANRALIENLAPFPEPIPMQHRPPGAHTMFEIEDEIYRKILERIDDPIGLEEGRNAFDMTVTESLFLRQLRGEQENICSFSGVRSEAPEAVMIRPIDEGGSWHIRNFILLDPAAAPGFLKFHWSIGPQFQLLLNAHAIGRDGTETASPSGKLAMPGRLIERLDRTSLEWHRQHFFDRLR